MNPYLECQEMQSLQKEEMKATVSLAASVWLQSLRGDQNDDHLMDGSIAADNHIDKSVVKVNPRFADQYHNYYGFPSTSQMTRTIGVTTSQPQQQQRQQVMTAIYFPFYKPFHHKLIGGNGISCW